MARIALPGSAGLHAQCEDAGWSCGLSPSPHQLVAPVSRSGTVQLVKDQILCLIILAGFLHGAMAQPKARLRVLTYNIHHGEGTDGRFDYERLAGVITDLNPDVVALHEVDRKTRRARGIDQPALMEKLTGMKSVFGRSFHYSGGEYGNAVLSRLPVDNVQTHYLPFRFGQEPRAAVAARVSPDNGLPRFILVSTHLSTRARGSEQAHQLNSLFPARKDHRSSWRGI